MLASPTMEPTASASDAAADVGRAADATKAVRSAHEEIRRNLAASNHRLERRADRIASIKEGRRSAQEALAERVAEARRELDEILPSDVQHKLTRLVKT